MGLPDCLTSWMLRRDRYFSKVAFELLLFHVIFVYLGKFISKILFFFFGDSVKTKNLYQYYATFKSEWFSCEMKSIYKIYIIPEEYIPTVDISFHIEVSFFLLHHNGIIW